MGKKCSAGESVPAVLTRARQGTHAVAAGTCLWRRMAGVSGQHEVSQVLSHQAGLSGLTQTENERQTKENAPGTRGTTARLWRPRSRTEKHLKKETKMPKCEVRTI